MEVVSCLVRWAFVVWMEVRCREERAVVCCALCALWPMCVAMAVVRGRTRARVRAVGCSWAFAVWDGLHSERSEVLEVRDALESLEVAREVVLEEGMLKAGGCRVSGSCSCYFDSWFRSSSRKACCC
jgi:hypothetical protein